VPAFDPVDTFGFTFSWQHVNDVGVPFESFDDHCNAQYLWDIAENCLRTLGTTGLGLAEGVQVVEQLAVIRFLPLRVNPHLHGLIRCDEKRLPEFKQSVEKAISKHDPGLKKAGIIPILEFHVLKNDVACAKWINYSFAAFGLGKQESCLDVRYQEGRDRCRSPEDRDQLNEEVVVLVDGFDEITTNAPFDEVLAPAIEIYSIDECFVDVTGITDLPTFGRKVRQTVLQETGIPCGVGIGQTKTLAKAANRWSKKGGGVVVLTDPSNILRELHCEDIWGIAGRLALRLQALGINTASELARSDRRMIRAKFGVVMERIVLELNGVSCITLEEVLPDRKNIVCSRSFGHPIENVDELAEAVASFASRGGEKLRRQNLAASSVSTFLLTNIHRPDLPQYSPTACRELLTPTSFTPTLVAEADKILRRIYRLGYRYVKAGILLNDLVSEDSNVQLHLFKSLPREKERAISRALDKLNNRYGRNIVRTGTMGVGARWDMKRDRKSASFTTSFRDIPLASIQ
jgi:DNA polymerase V